MQYVLYIKVHSFQKTFHHIYYCMAIELPANRPQNFPTSADTSIRIYRPVNTLWPATATTTVSALLLASTANTNALHVNKQRGLFTRIHNRQTSRYRIPKSFRQPWRERLPCQTQHNNNNR